MKVIELYRAVDTLQTLCDLKDIHLQNCDTVQILLSEKIKLQEQLIETNTNKQDLCRFENKTLKKTIRNRTFLLIGSAILNTFLLIKSI